MSRCAVPGCTDPCRSGMLMCRWHWFRVPVALRRAVNSAWKELVAANTAPDRSEARLKARLVVIREYQAAKTAAVDFICTQEGLTRVG
jgi:hypothetical protein